MSKVRLLPHNTADEACFSAGPWLVRYPDSETVELAAFLADFDYGLALEFGFRATVDLDRVRELTGLADDSEIGIYSLADCQSSDLRVSNQTAANGNEQEVWIRAEPASLAGSVELSRGLVTIAAGSTNGGYSPTRTGSRLLDDKPCVAVLEGGLSRFPVVSVPFSQTRHPGDAAWVLTVDYEDPADPFLGAVRLNVNREHAAGRLVLSRETSPEAETARSALRTDVVRQFLQILACDERLDSVVDHPTESVIGVATSLSRDALAMDLANALAMLGDDPARLDAHLQAALGYLGGRAE